jgi:hypothetical protein
VVYSFKSGEETATSTRTAFSWNRDQDRYSDDDLEPSVYTKMLRTSGHCAQALRFTQNQILSLIGNYEHEDEEITKVIRALLVFMEGSWRRVLIHGLDAVWWGFSVQEKVMESFRVDGSDYWGYLRIKPTAQESWYPRGLITNKFGRLERLVQWKDVPQYEAELELERAIHWSYQGRGSVWGWGAARAAHPWYQVHRDVLELWMIGLERLSSGIIIDLEHKGASKNELGEDVPNVEKAAELWSQTTTGDAIIREAVVDEDGNVFPQVNFLTGSGWQGEFSDTMVQAAKELYVAVGVPPMLQMEPEHSSRAQSETVNSVTQTMLLPIAEEYTEEVLIEQVVRPLIEWNWGEMEDYGGFPVQTPVDQEGLSKILGELRDSGFVVPINPAHYARVQALFPDILPPYEEHESEGGFTAGLPSLPEIEVNAEEAVGDGDSD